MGEYNTSLLHTFLEHGNFFNTEISQDSVPMCLICNQMFNNDYCKFTSESVSEKILKISILRSYRQKSSVLVFLLTVYNAKYT